MKKARMVAAIIVLFLSIEHSYGFIENRLQWWQVRLTKLEAERTKMQEATPGSPLLGVIDKDIARARAIIDVFEREMKHDGSLTHLTRVITDADIVAEALAVVPTLCALRRLELLVKDPDGADPVSAARDTAGRRIASLAKQHFGEADDGLTRRIMAEDISAAEWRVLAVEVLAGSAIAGRGRFEEQALNGTVAAVSLKLREKNNTANGRELRTLTVSAALEYLDACNAPDRSHDDDALAASWTWKRKEALINRDFAAYKKIMALPGCPAGLTLEQVRRFHRNPSDLEPVLFTPRNAENKPAPAPAPAGSAPGALTLEIPALPAENPLREEMGRIRRATLPTITGREGPGFINDLDVRLKGVIQRGTEDARRAVAREEEKARLLGIQEGPRAVIKNEREFNEARRIVHERLASLEECRARTVALVALVSEGKRMAGSEIAERYRYLLERNRQYLRLAGDLFAVSARISSFGGPREQKRFAACLNGTSALFTAIGATLGIDKNDRPYLSQKEIGSIRARTVEFTGWMQQVRGGVRQDYAGYARALSRTAGADLKGNEGLKEKIAQDDIDAQREHAADCAALYQRYEYGGEMISRYAKRYVAYLKEARSGAASPGLESAVRSASILASLDGFNAARVRSELTAKRYLKGEAKAALARLYTLLRYYRKNNVRVPDAPIPEEIAMIEKGLGAGPQARIDSWTMNESNMEEIDAKAARKLSLLLHRNAPSPGRKQDGGAGRQAERGRTITIQDPDLSFDVPAGWAEETVGQTEAFQGVVKAFSAGEGGPTVRLVRLPMENDDMKDTAENWVRKSGCVLVEKRWERGPEAEYLWILAKDGDKNITETCSLYRDGFTVLITGKTSRDRYPRFRSHLRKIIDSIN